MWALTKPEINLLIAITVLVGFLLSQPISHSISVVAVFNVLMGTLLVSSGAAVLNQFMERRFDCRMRCTARRPLVLESITPHFALLFGAIVSILGLVYLRLLVNPLSSFIAGLTSVIYLGAYTPLKRITPLCTLVGAIPGAAPPLIGWAAATGTLGHGAWTLYTMLFLWQFPHFMAIAWMYRDDYDRAGYLVLPKGNSRISFVILQTLMPLIALLAVSIMQSPAHHVPIFRWAVALLGAGFLYFGVAFAMLGSRGAARHLLRASIVYLPLLFGLSLAFCNRVPS